MKTTLRPLRSPRRGLAGLPEHERRRFAVDVGGLKIAKIWIWVGVPRGSGLRLLTVPPRRHVTNRGNGLGLQRTWKNYVKIVKKFVNLKHSCQTLKIVGKNQAKSIFKQNFAKPGQIDGKNNQNLYFAKKSFFWVHIVLHFKKKSRNPRYIPLRYTEELIWQFLLLIFPVEIVKGHTSWNRREYLKNSSIWNIHNCKTKSNWRKKSSKN